MERWNWEEERKVEIGLGGESNSALQGSPKSGQLGRIPIRQLCREMKMTRMLHLRR